MIWESNRRDIIRRRDFNSSPSTHLSIVYNWSRYTNNTHTALVASEWASEWEEEKITAEKRVRTQQWQNPKLSTIGSSGNSPYHIHLIFHLALSTLTVRAPKKPNKLYMAKRTEYSCASIWILDYQFVVWIDSSIVRACVLVPFAIVNCSNESKILLRCLLHR